MICGHDWQLIIEDLFEGDRDLEDPAHDESNSPTTHEALDRRRSRHSSEIQVVFTQLILIKKQNNKLTTEVQTLQSHSSKKVKHLTS